MVVSENKGTPSILQSLYYGRRQKGTANFKKLPYTGSPKNHRFDNLQGC